MKRLAAILLLCLALLPLRAQDEEPLRGRRLPACAKPDSSRLHFPAGRERFERLAGRLVLLRECPDSSVTIWHMGGSHVQAGWFSSRIRADFDSLGKYPAADRGYVFPYPLAGTNYDFSFLARGEGEWTGSRCTYPNKKMPVSPPFGIMGSAAYTADTLAALSFGMPRPFRRLHIMGEGSDTLVAPVVIAGADTLLCTPDTLLNGYFVEFAAPVDSVRIEPRLQEGQHFVITGLLPESGSTGGLHYVSTGVNGQNTRSWFDRCPEFLRESSILHPDLVVLGLGINDSAASKKNFSPERFKRNYRELLDYLLELSPDCCFVFLTNNDSWRFVRRGMVHNENGAAVQKAMYELAEEYGGAVWDLYEIMGGSGSATKWRADSLMRKDRLHFTRAGYELLGDMFYEALARELE